MAKILVSDLSGTLIPKWIGEFEYYYGSGSRRREFMELMSDKEYWTKLVDRVFEQLGNQLEKFLSEGNYLYLVTDADSHDGPDFILNEIISRVYKNTSRYQDRISVFLTGVIGKDSKMGELLNGARIYTHNQDTYAVNKEGIQVGLLYNKSDVFDFIRREHDIDSDSLFAIGDSWQDIPMLFSCIELGGESSLIQNDLYREDVSITELLHKSARNARELMMYDFVPGYADMSPDERLSISVHSAEVVAMRHKWYFSELDKLYTELLQEKLDLDSLQREECIFSTMSEYDILDNGRHPLALKSALDHIDVYPTFIDYRDKVLVKKNDGSRAE